jgi:hypothetical protein
MSIETIDQAIADIHSVSRFLEQCSLDLYSRRNALLPVNRLPRELLAYIFDQCSPTAYYLAAGEGQDESENFDYPQTIFAFSQVCKHWRDTALDTPSLWTTPIFDWPSCAAISRTMLGRARGCPIYITAGLGAVPNVRTVTKTIQAESSRVLDLVLSGSPSNMKTVMRAFEGRSAPLLEDMCLSVKVSDEDPDEDHILRLNGQAFSAAPRLNHIELYNCMISAPSPLYQHLTSLYMSASGVDVGLDFRELTQIVRSAPRLEELTLYEVYQYTGQAEEPSKDPVVLPHMRSLVLDDATTFMVSMLQQLKMPATATVSLTSSWEDWPTVRLLEDLFRHLSGHYNQGKPWTHLRLVSHPRGFMDIEAFADELRPDLNFEFEDTQMYLKMQLGGDTDPHRARFPDLWNIISTDSVLPLHSLVSLSLTQYHQHNITESSLRALFGRMPSLTEVLVKQAFAAPIVKVLSIIECGQAVCAPLLKNLTLNNIRLMDPSREPIPGDEESLLLYFVDPRDISRMLQARTAADRGIRTLSLCNCRRHSDIYAGARELESYVAHYVHGNETQVRVSFDMSNI